MSIYDRVSKLEREVEKLKKPTFIVTPKGTFPHDYTKPVIEGLSYQYHTGPVPAKPVVKAGDRARVTPGGTWYEVSYVMAADSFVYAPYFRTTTNKSFNCSQIIDIYTKEEFEKNSALVQYQDWTGIYNHLSEKFGFSHFPEYTRGVFSFLTSNAVQKLGEFKPVDRPIKVGDCVRFETYFGKKTVAETVKKDLTTGGGIFQGTIDSEDGREWNRTEEELTLVAKEDPKYVVAPENPCKHPDVTLRYAWVANSKNRCTKCGVVMKQVWVPETLDDTK